MEVLEVGQFDSVHYAIDDVERKTLGSYETFRVVDHLSQYRLFVESPVLPAGAKYYVRHGQVSAIVLEDEPMVRNIKFDEKRYRLALPYVIYIFLFDGNSMPGYSSRLFYRTTPLKSVDDMLSRTNLSHVSAGAAYNVGTVCLNSAGGAIDEGTKSFQANASKHSFWGASFRSTFAFNKEWQDLYATAGSLDPRLINAERWAEATVDNRNFMLGIKWSNYKTLKETVTETIGSYEGNRFIKGQFDKSISTVADVMLRW